MDYENLDSNSKKWIDENVLIFSNLFGVISAKDLIPYYVLKQAVSIIIIPQEIRQKEFC